MREPWLAAGSRFIRTIRQGVAPAHAASCISVVAALHVPPDGGRIPSDMRRPHHFVVLVIDDVAVPDIPMLSARVEREETEAGKRLLIYGIIR